MTEASTSKTSTTKKAEKAEEAPEQKFCSEHYNKIGVEIGSDGDKLKTDENGTIINKPVS